MPPVAAESLLSDAAIQQAIDAGCASKVKAIWSGIEKRHPLRVNRQGFGDTVGKTAIFPGDKDLIELAASEAARRHQTLSVTDVKNWPGLGANRCIGLPGTRELRDYVVDLPACAAGRRERRGRGLEYGHVQRHSGG